MNFYQAPITRYLNIPGANPTSTTFTQVTASTQAFSTTAPFMTVSSANTTWYGGVATNVFFETPNWPSSSYIITVEYNASAAAAPLLVGPNIMMLDADANYFIRGNAVAASTAASSINVMYCATLTNVVPEPNSARTSAVNSSWIQPGDRMDLSDNGQSTTNQAAAEAANAGSSVTVQACRFKTNSTNFVVEFNAAIRSDGNNPSGTASGFTPTSTSPSSANTAAYELKFKYSDGTFKSLAADSMVLKVIGRDTNGNIVWRGTLSFAVNLTYPANNKTGLISSYFDPGRFTQVTKAWALGNLRPLVGAGTAFQSQRIYVDRDLVAGAEPYRCISLYNSGSVGYQVALTIQPIS